MAPGQIVPASCSINKLAQACSAPSIKLFVTYHPAFLLRDPRQKKETWKDLQQVMRYLNLPLPTKSANSLANTEA